MWETKLKLNLGFSCSVMIIRIYFYNVQEWKYFKIQLQLYSAQDLSLTTYPHNPHQRMTHSYDLFLTFLCCTDFCLSHSFQSVQVVQLQGESLKGSSNSYQEPAALHTMSFYCDDLHWYRNNQRTAQPHKYCC